MRDKPFNTYQPTTLISLQQALERGLECEPAEERPCPFCGEPMEPRGLAAPDGTVHWLFSAPCGCEGARAAAARAEADARREAERAERGAAERRLSRAGIARRYFAAEATQPAARSYVSGFDPAAGRGLYLVGPVGAGKTHEASGIAKAFMRAGYAVRFTTSLAMLDAVYSAQRTRVQGRPCDDGAAEFMRADLLVVDDLGKENANRWAVTTLFRIVDHRYGELLPTVFTSQYDLGQLQRRLSREGEAESAAALTSRIAEMCDVAALGGADRRREAAAAREQGRRT